MDLLSASLQLPVYDAAWFQQIKDEPFPFKPKGTYTNLLGAWLQQFPGEHWVKPEEGDPNGKRSIRERIVRSPDWLFSRWPEVRGRGERGGCWEGGSGGRGEEQVVY